jgi:acyl-CoA thioester hydrolase
VRFEDSTLPLRVRPNDLDSLGHVNNATALEYLETGRWAWLEGNGLRQGASVIGLTMRVEVDYRKEIAPQEVVVWTHLEAPSPEEMDDPEAVHYRVRFHQKILVDSGRQLAVEAHVQAGFVRVADRSLCTVQEFLEACRSSKS